MMDAMGDERLLSWMLTAGVFFLLLAFSSSHGGWWRSRASQRQPAQATFANARATPANPFAATTEYIPSRNVQARAAPNDPPDAVPPAPSPLNEARIEPRIERQIEPQGADATPGIDYQAMDSERNRGVTRNSRTR
jgi:hypothetical protein